MSTTPPTPDREKARQTRKRVIAQQQITQFEDELSSHELNRARLVAVGGSTDEVDRAIAAIKQAISTTAAEAAKINA